MAMQVKMFNLYSKTIMDIQESYDQFIISNQSLELIGGDLRHIVLRFWRKYDAVFRPGKVQVLCLNKVCLAM